MMVRNCVSWHNSKLWKRNETFRIAPGTWDSFMNKFGVPSLLGKKGIWFFFVQKKKEAKYWSLAESSREIMQQEKSYINYSPRLRHRCTRQENPGFNLKLCFFTPFFLLLPSFFPSFHPSSLNSFFCPFLVFVGFFLMHYSPWRLS